MQIFLPQHDLPHGWDSHGHPSGLPGHTAWKRWRKKQRQSLSPRWVPFYFSPLSFAPSLRYLTLNYSSMKHLHRISNVLGTMISTDRSHSWKWLCVHILGAGIKWHSQEKWTSDKAIILKTTFEVIELKWNWSLNPGRIWVYGLWSRRHSWNG